VGKVGSEKNWWVGRSGGLQEVVGGNLEEVVSGQEW